MIFIINKITGDFLSSYTFKILDGVLLTLKLSLASIVLAIFLGSIGCIFRLSKLFFKTNEVLF